MAPTARRSWPLPVLFSSTAFVGAALIFMVQPLVSKLLLPAYGGSAAVWTTASFFFQVVLLLGYVFVHASVRAGRGRQPLLIAPVALLALVFLPLALPSSVTPDGQDPTWWLIRALLLMVALPFLVLSTTGPLLQKWYSWTDAPRSQDPYFLYAASNVGSFVGLFSYPFLIEPLLTLSAQRWAWSGAFLVFLVLLACCGLTLLRSTPAAEALTEDEAEHLGFSRQVKWVALAFLPSALMLAVTTHIATDVASVPLLWVIPLGIYILTMVVAFARTSRRTSPIVTAAAFFGSIFALGLALSPHLVMPKLTAGALFLVLLLVAYAAHSLLANDRPTPAHLTRYFVLVSLGGALGGLFNSVLAPLIFSYPLEFPLLLALVPALFAAYRNRSGTIFALVVPSLLLVTVGVDALRDSPGVLERSRTFYGSYKVTGDDQYHEFVHGTTIHGLQLVVRPEFPASYYIKQGPVGDLFSDRTFDQTTVIGLGIGQLAAYGEPGTRMDFIEIDPEVIRIARDPDLFTYLADTEAEVTTKAQDGRLALEAVPDSSQDMIFLDAFSSDAIPVHLLTQEALATYADKLAPEGVLVVHISNRIFDLVPVIYTAADKIGLPPLYKTVGRDVVGPLGQPSTFMALPNGEAEMERLLDLGWRDLRTIPEPPARVEWTDDYSSVLSVLR